MRQLEGKLIVVSFEFDLIPTDPSGRFSPDALAQMRAWWSRLPTATAPDGTLTVFPTEEIREIRVERQRAEPGNDYQTAHVSFEEDRVVLSVTGDGATSQWLYDFAVEAERRWHGTLQYFGERVPPEDILAGDE